MKTLKLFLCLAIWPLLSKAQFQQISIDQFPANWSRGVEQIEGKLYLSTQQGNSPYRIDTIHSIRSFDQNLVLQDSLNLNPILDSLVPDTNSLNPGYWYQNQILAGRNKEMFMLISYSSRYLTPNNPPCGFSKPFLLIFEKDLRLKQAIDLSTKVSGINTFLYSFSLNGNQVFFSGDFQSCGTVGEQGPYISSLNLASGSYMENRSLADSIGSFSQSLGRPSHGLNGLFVKANPYHLYEGAKVLKLAPNLDFQKAISLKDSAIRPNFSHWRNQAILNLGVDSVLIIGAARGVSGVSSFNYHWNLASSMLVQDQKVRTDTFPFCEAASSLQLYGGDYDRPSLNVDAIEYSSTDSIFVAITTGEPSNVYVDDPMELYLYNINGKTGATNWRSHFTWPKTITNVSVDRLGADWVLSFTDAYLDNGDVQVSTHLWILDERGTLLHQKELAKSTFVKLELYPNPAKDFITVKGIGEVEGRSYKLLNLRGDQVGSGSLDSEARLKVDMLAKGIYFLHIASYPALRLVVD